jgi:sulfatase modifying factor 1
VIAVVGLLVACGGKTKRDWVGSRTGEPTGSGGTGATASNNGSGGGAGAAGSRGSAACIPDCEGKECGNDGCGSTCSPGCSISQTCNAGQCDDLVYGPEGQSCSAMTGTECNGESCCASIVVPGGTFPMGRGTETCVGCSDGCPAETSCWNDELPEHPATVSRFALDRYEVTVGRFRVFVEAYDAGWRPDYDTGWRPSEGEGANPAVELAQGLAAGATGWQSEWDWELPAFRILLEDSVSFACAGPYDL